MTKISIIGCLNQFEELLDFVISKGNSDDFEEFKEKVIERLEEID